MSIRIFKMISGELVVAKLVASDDSSSGGYNISADQVDRIKLHDLDEFLMETPIMVVHTPNGVGFAPMVPWCDPKTAASVLFHGRSIMAEMPHDDPAHDPIREEYRRLTSRIQTPANSIGIAMP